MFHGVLNIYKEKGFTSHDVVAKLRRITHQKKIGHTGTLDPDATGVLPVCFGKATKLCDMLTDKDKEYEAVLLLGVTTDTQDTTGEILSERDAMHLSANEAQQAVLSFVGEYDQIPPMYSALKVNGKKLYELAREGKVVERKARHVSILSIEILEIQMPRVRMRVHCSKGTYIRTLCHDIGEKLGCGGAMEELIRTRVERFKIEDAITLSQAEDLMNQEVLGGKMIAIDEMLSSYEKVYLTDETAAAVRCGNPFFKSQILKTDYEGKWQDGQNVLVYDKDGQFIAVYQYQNSIHGFKIQKMFFDGKNE